MLPINTTPIYTTSVPSTSKSIKFRPFLVKEEKALLIAQQSEDQSVMIDTLKSVISSCVQTVPFNVNALATFDIEYLFAQIRAKSVGEIVELSFRCDTCEDENAVAQVKLDITKIKVDIPVGHNTKISLMDDGSIGVNMRYPNFDLLKDIQFTNPDDIDQAFKVVMLCIEYIYTSDQMYMAKDHTEQELKDFLENLTSDQFAKIQNFFETMPSIKQKVDYTCPVCSKKHSVVIEGIESFF